ncbi:TM2 domain-containing protein [Bartonella sp. CB175]|uniref:TM2 domain-containing protein n=1 Tax=Bartonella sp. CB175 TaxID=3112256 RepID=UPI00300DCC9F
MKGMIINHNQGIYLISGDDGKRYKFALLDWLGKVAPRIGESVDFICNDDLASSVVPLSPVVPSVEQKYSRVVLLFVCLFLGPIGVHRFIVGRIWTGVLMLVLSISFFGTLISGVWMLVDFICIATGQFSDKNGNKITD